VRCHCAYTLLCVDGGGWDRVQNDSTEVVHFLLSSEIIPLCLRIMETGSELSKTVCANVRACVCLCLLGCG
jgi:CCR4-NOT transcription complex subunit 9